MLVFEGAQVSHYDAQDNKTPLEMIYPYRAVSQVIDPL
jgi:hypothetical protein